MNHKEIRPVSLEQFWSLLAQHENDDTAGSRDRNVVVMRPDVAVIRHAMPKAVLTLLNQPIRLREMRVIIIKRGWAEPVINLLPCRCEAGDLIFVSSNSTAQIIRTSADLTIEGFSITDELFRLSFASNIPKAFNGHVRDFCLHTEPQERRFLSGLIRLLYRATLGANHETQVLRNLSAAFFWYVNNMWEKRQQDETRVQTHDARLLTDFISLVNEHVRRRPPISFYASKLCLSPRYLSTLIKEVSGKSAKQWTDEALLTAIRVDLIHTDKSMKQIADELNFPNTSFFCKYFKRMTGLTPLAYRNSETTVAQTPETV